MNTRRQMKCAVPEKVQIVEYKNVIQNVSQICAHILKHLSKFLIKDARVAFIRFRKSRKIRIDAFALALVKGQGAFKRGCSYKIQSGPAKAYLD